MLDADHWDTKCKVLQQVVCRELLCCPSKPPPHFNVNSMFVTNFFFSSQTNRIKHFKPDDDSDSENNSTYNGNSTQQQ